MKLFGFFLILASITVLNGCFASGNILKVEGSESGFEGAVYPPETRLLVDIKELDKYPVSQHFRVFEQSPTGFGSIPEARDQAMPRVVEFCRAKNKKPKILKELTSVPPHILGNFPRVEMIFVCVEDSAIASGNTNIADRYAIIKQLKSLLDSKAISQEEYDKEKTKLLNQ